MSVKRPTNSLGKKIVALRKERGFTQRRLADLADLSNDYISKIEKGKNTNVGVETLQRIADALMVTPLELQYPGDLSDAALAPEQNFILSRYALKPDVATRDLLRMWAKLDRADRKVILNVAKQLLR